MKLLLTLVNALLTVLIKRFLKIINLIFFIFSCILILIIILSLVIFLIYVFVTAFSKYAYINVYIIYTNIFTTQ